MNWRVIVRMSFSGKENSSLRNSIAKYLKACGLKPTGALGTWEGRNVSAGNAAKQFARVFEVLSDPTTQIGVRASLDHLWIYIDRAKMTKGTTGNLNSVIQSK